MLIVTVRPSRRNSSYLCVDLNVWVFYLSIPSSFQGSLALSYGTEACKAQSIAVSDFFGSPLRWSSKRSQRMCPVAATHECPARSGDCFYDIRFGASFIFAVSQCRSMYLSHTCVIYFELEF